MLDSVEAFLHIVHGVVSEVEFLELDLLDADSKLRINRFLQPADRARGIVSALLQRQIAATRFSVPLRDVVFSKGARGKPVLHDSFLYQFPEAMRFRWNTSHDGECVAVLSCNNDCIGNVGLDVMAVTLPRRHASFQSLYQVMKRQFTHIEATWLYNLSNPLFRNNGKTLSEAELQLLKFYVLWTTKEAYLKCTGQGLAIPLNFLEVEQGDGIDQDSVTLNCSESCEDTIQLLPRFYLTKHGKPLVHQFLHILVTTRENPTCRFLFCLCLDTGNRPNVSINLKSLSAKEFFELCKEYVC